MRRQTVLVVDDDRVVAQAVERELLRHFDVTVAENGIQALERLRAGRVDVILSDNDLGGPLSGVDLLSLVADCYPATRRILYTGSPFEREACQVAHAALEPPLADPSIWDAVGL